jgi:cytochrome c2
MRILIAFFAVLPVAVHAADPNAEAKGIMAGQCSSCHTIPGVAGAFGDIGPSLKGMGTRPTIAAKLPNNDANMVRWLMHPQQVLPGTQMPDLGLSEDQARKIAVYLHTLNK